MRVKMLTTAANPDGVWPAGQVVDVPIGVGQALIDGGYAQVVDEAKVIESAAIEPPEKAVLPTAKRKKVK